MTTTTAPSIPQLCERFNLTLPKNAIEWRTTWATERKDFPIGSHSQLYSSLKLLCTDGVVAWALLGDDETLVFIQLKSFIPRTDEDDAESRSGLKGKKKLPSKNLLDNAEED